MMNQSIDESKIRREVESILALIYGRGEGSRLPDPFVPGLVRLVGRSPMHPGQLKVHQLGHESEGVGDLLVERL